MKAPPVEPDLVNAFQESFVLNGNEAMPVTKSKTNVLKPYLTTAQKKGLTTLVDCGRLFKIMGRQCQGGFAPKLWKLIIGQTGSGKTNLAYQLAKRMQWELLIIDCGSWIPHGALAKPATLQTVRDFVRANDEGVIFCDEICKAVPSGSSSSWSLGVFSEVLSFLDGQKHLLGHEWTERDLDKFRHKFFVIGGGAFQSAFKNSKANARKGSLGFQKSASKTREGYSEEIYESDLIPDEVLTRFSATHIHLTTPTEGDIREAVRRFHGEMDIAIDRDMDGLVGEAMESKAGMRWVEDYIASVLMAHPDKAKPPEESSKEEADNIRDLFGPNLYHNVNRANDACGALRTSLGKLWGELAKNEYPLKHHSDARFRYFLYGTAGDSVPDKVYRALRCITLIYDTNNVSLEDGGTSSIRDWSITGWEGITNYAPPLATFGLMPLWIKAWESSVRIIEIRMRILAMVEAGKLS